MENDAQEKIKRLDENFDEAIGKLFNIFQQIDFDKLFTKESD